MSTKRFDLNLATQPLVNRNLFFILCGFLIVLIVALAVHSGLTYFKYSGKDLDTGVQTLDLEKKKDGMQDEEKRLNALIQETDIEYRYRIDLLNEIILRKSFSWTDFLSDLEQILPGSCHIVSLAPSPRPNQTMKVVLTLVSPVLQDVITFINSLHQQGFRNVRPEGESRAENGDLLVRMSFVYERNH